MGNIASAVCITGAVLVVAVKPACDYTIRLVLEKTSLIVNNRLTAVEQDVRRAIELVTETNKSLGQVKDAIYKQAGTLSRVQEQPNGQHSPRVPKTMLQAIENIATTNDTVSKLPDRMSKMEEIVLQTVNCITKTNEAVNALPSTIDTTVKKYSMYLHDEHVNMFELMSGVHPLCSGKSTKGKENI